MEKKLSKLIFSKVVVVIPYLVLAGIGIQYYLSSVDPENKPVTGQIQVTRRPHQKLIAEFKPTDGVLVSSMLFEDGLGGRELVRGILAGRAQPVILSNQAETPEAKRKWLKAQGFEDSEIEKIEMIGIMHDTYWLRDFSAFPVEQGGPGATRLLKLADPIYRSDSLLNDTIPYQLGLHLRASVEQMPIYMDGGNFLSDGNRCFIAEGAKESLTVYDDRVLHYQVTPLADVKDQLKFTLGCSEVVSFPDAPHEHIDMWAKIIDEKHAVISQIPPQAMERAKNFGSEELIRLQEVNRSLDSAAMVMAEYLEVKRIPMPIPFDKVFRNYTNATIVNDVIIVPKYETFVDMDKAYPDQDLMPGYEADVRRVYESFGLKVRFVNSDQLIQHGGAVHCATSQIPRLL